MARETKAQRLEREAAEELARKTSLVANWPTKLMLTLERATRESYVLGVENLAFVVKYPDRWEEECAVRFPYAVTTATVDAAMEAVYELETEFAMLDSAREEARRKAEARSNALAKLTKEDRVALGLEKL